MQPTNHCRVKPPSSRTQVCVNHFLEEGLTSTGQDGATAPKITPRIFSFLMHMTHEFRPNLRSRCWSVLLFFPIKHLNLSFFPQPKLGQFTILWSMLLIDSFCDALATKPQLFRLHFNLSQWSYFEFSLLKSPNKHWSSNNSSNRNKL